MSKRIAQLLGEPEHMVTKLISELEAKNGYPSQDARLISETVQKIRKKIAKLGLDPDDTTAEELYQALLSRYKRNCDWFDKLYGVSSAPFGIKAAKASEIVLANITVTPQWALKSTAAKQTVRQLPPKKVMKLLGYRSAESMLKRENLANIYLCAQIIESDTWHKTQNKLIAKLDQTGFELRPVRITTLSYENLNPPTKTNSYFLHDDNLAVIALSPSLIAVDPSLLTMVILLTEKLTADNQTKLSRALVKFSPIVGWWVDLDYLIANLGNRPISFSLKDNALNQLHKNDLARSTLDHGRSSFWKELLSRYENLPALEARFDNSVRSRLAAIKMTVPEPLFEFAEDM